jgi:hypothetical protein
VSDDKLRIKGNTILLDYLRSDMLSMVPNHPALGLLVPNQQGFLTAEEDSTQASHSRVEKRKTRSSDEPDSYEVEEILGHRCDNQANI